MDDAQLVVAWCEVGISTYSEAEQYLSMLRQRVHTQPGQCCIPLALPLRFRFCARLSPVCWDTLWCFLRAPAWSAGGMYECFWGGARRVPPELLPASSDFDKTPQPLRKPPVWVELTWEEFRQSFYEPFVHNFPPGQWRLDPHRATVYYTSPDLGPCQQSVQQWLGQLESLWATLKARHPSRLHLASTKRPALWTEAYYVGVT